MSPSKKTMSVVAICAVAVAAMNAVAAHSRPTMIGIGVLALLLSAAVAFGDSERKTI